MSQSEITVRIQSSIFVIFCILFASSCAGTKILKEPLPMQSTQALSTASDDNLDATLDWVIVRDGPGTWAKNADWDEYQFRVINTSSKTLTINQIIVVDSLDARIDARSDRKALVLGSKETVQHYKDSYISIKAGQGTGTMLATAAAVTVVGAGVLGATIVGVGAGGIAVGSSAAVVVAGGLLLAGPVLMVGGIARGLNNNAVNEEIVRRQTHMPIELLAGAESPLDIFFPLAPSPKAVEITYTDAEGTRVLNLDTRIAMEGLHIVEQE